MSTIPTDPPSANAHEGVEMLLPWYVNGRLSAVETAEVEQHLERCSVCRAELEQCRALARTLHQQQPIGWQPAPGHFERALAEIERLEAKTPPVQPPRYADSDTRSTATAGQSKPIAFQRQYPPWLQRLRDWLGATPVPVRWTLALESLAVAALLLVLLVPGRMPATPGYETLSNDDQPAALAGPRLRVVFNETATVADLRDLLLPVNGGIVTGPTALGVFIVALPDGSRAQPSLTEALVRLRASPQVRVVEPLMPGRKP